jgi:hypothetical protein
MSTLAVNSIVPANAGSEDYFLVRAWISVDQTGTQAINASGNVSSITDNANGDTSMSFSSVLTSGNYAFSAGVAGSTHNEREYPTGKGSIPQTSSVCRMRVLEGGVSSTDHSQFTVTVVI